MDLSDVEANDGSAFVYLPVIENELFRRTIRRDLAEYQTRNPYCVDLRVDGATIRIANAGMTASDLVVLDYKVVFCTAPEHGPIDGFTVDHAGEQRPLEIEKAATAAVVLPGSVIDQIITWEPADWAENIYLRARVSTLWSEDVPIEAWNPAEDLFVTEAYLKLR